MTVSSEVHALLSDPRLRQGPSLCHRQLAAQKASHLRVIIENGGDYQIALFAVGDAGSESTIKDCGLHY